jgi:hypothetical protein
MIDTSGNFPNNSLDGVLKAGLQVIDRNQTIRFVKYTRVILPYDKYVYWVLSSLLASTTAAPVLEVAGSFHYNTDQKQELASTIAYQNVIFTTGEEIADLNKLQPDEMYLGYFNDIQFSFSSHKNYYEQAGLWHYEGQAVYPQMRTQIIDDLSELNSNELVVSNSLPLWIALNDFAPVFPSYLVPENLSPPYIVCHIDEDRTTPLQPIPLVNSEGTWQLSKDKVKLVIYGFNNQSIQNYTQYLMGKSLCGNTFGILNMGLGVKDGKYIQSEINVLAQEKFIELEVSYNQHAIYEAVLNYISRVLPVSVTTNSI